MAEFIEKTDTLNKGREKINAAIQDAEDAKTIARQAVNTSNQAKQIAQAAEDKADSTQTQLDTIVIEGDSSVEAAQARVDEKGQTHSTLKNRIDDGFIKVNTHLAQIENNIAIVNVKDFGALGDGLTDDTIPVRQAISTLKSLGGGILKFPKAEYKVNHLLIDFDNVVVEGNDSTLIYNGDPDEEIQGKNKSDIFNISQANNIKMFDLNLIGPMFTGFDMDNLPTEIIDNAFTSQSKGIHVSQSNNLLFENIKIREFSTNFNFIDSNDFKLVNCDSSLTNMSYKTERCRGFTLDSCKSTDSRFTFNRTHRNVPEKPGSLGHGFLFNKSEGYAVNCVDIRSATDAFRVENNSNIHLKNCKSISPRRQSYSTYYENSYLYLEDCESINAGDQSFWTGNDDVDTFRRPAEWGQCFCVIVHGQNNKVVIKGGVYKTEKIDTLPTRSSYKYNNKVTNNNIYCKTGNALEMYGTKVIGYAMNELVNIEHDRTGPFIMEGCTVESMPLLEGETTSKRSILVLGDNAVIRNNTFLFGKCFFTVENLIFSGNKVSKSHSHAVYFMDSKNVLATNNQIEDISPPTVSGVRGFMLKGDGILLSNNLVTSDSEKVSALEVYLIDGSQPPSYTIEAYGNLKLLF